MYVFVYIYLYITTHTEERLHLSTYREVSFAVHLNLILLYRQQSIALRLRITRHILLVGRWVVEIAIVWSVGAEGFESRIL